MYNSYVHQILLKNYEESPLLLFSMVIAFIAASTQHSCTQPVVVRELESTELMWIYSLHVPHASAVAHAAGFYDRR